MTTRSTSLLLTLLAGGCGAGGIPLAQLEPSILEVAVSTHDVTAHVTWAPPRTDADPCRAAPDDLRATFDGVPLRLVSPGGQVDVLGGTRCDSVATFALDTTTDFNHARPQSDLTITDGETTLTASFANLVAPRSLSPVGADVVTPGGTATFQVAPATDTPFGVEKLQWATPRGTTGATGAVVDGSQLTVAVPADAHPGDALTLSWGRGEGVTKAQAIVCTGVAECTGRAMVSIGGATVRVP